jgi:hypothetical protein
MMRPGQRDRQEPKDHRGAHRGAPNPAMSGHVVWLALQDHRAIGVPLTTVKDGTGRPLAGIQVGRSGAITACSVQIPKLIVQAEEIGAIGIRGKVQRSWRGSGPGMAPEL